MDYKLLNMINKASESASDQFLLIDDVEEAINFGIGQYDFSSLISADFLRAHSEALDIANQYGDTSEDDIADHALYFVVGETMDVILRSQK
jgi:hypothetical protein